MYSTKLDGSGGFLKQIYELFSPDEYYAERLCYQRYAMLPFIVFTQALDNNMPELKIFEFKNGFLIKAENTVLQLTNSKSEIFITRLEVNDPNFILRNQGGMFIRNPNSKNVKLLTMCEMNGNYNTASEAVMQSEGSAENMKLIERSDEKVVIQLELKNDIKIQLLLDLNFSNSAKTKFN